MSKESIDRLRVKAQNEQTVLGLAEVLRLERQRVAELQAKVDLLESERAKEWTRARDAEASLITQSAVLAELRAELASRQSCQESGREVFQHIEELISGHDSFVCQDVQRVINQHLRPNGRDPNCEACHGDGEYLGHSPDCDDDLCALNGDMYSCVGEVVKCDCKPAPLPGEPSA